MWLLLLLACGGPGTDTARGTCDMAFCEDLDGDGWGSAICQSGCDQPDEYTWRSGDCDDSNPDIHPGQEEACNGIDDNCVDGIDEGLSDCDGDGICDDLDQEECDGLDNDCDGEIDEGFPDSDGDGIADCVDED